MTGRLGVSFPSLGSAGEDFIFRWGLTDDTDFAIGSSYPTNWIGFMYSGNIDSDFWRYVSCSGGKERSFRSKAQAIENWQRLSLSVNSNATLATYYVSGIVVGSLESPNAVGNPGGFNGTGYIPRFGQTIEQDMGPFIHLIKSVGNVTTRYADVDYYFLKQHLTLTR
mgnify:FL=1